MAQTSAQVGKVHVETEDRAKKIPEPVGYKLLIAPVAASEQSEGGILKPQDIVDRETTATVCGLVVAVGPDAYKDQRKFPTGPWCEVGDIVVFRSYSGTRIKCEVDGKRQEFRLINDDTVEAVVEDPRGYSAA
jgi:co-chaperonin GroES (HSP10)